MATTNILKTASVLAFERKIDPSDALFAAGTWALRNASRTWPAVEVRAKSVRGTISNRLKGTAADPAKLDAAIESPNLQTVDVCMLPADADTLKISFTLRVLGGTGTPSACNSADYQAKLQATVQSYAATAWVRSKSKFRLPRWQTGKHCSAGRLMPWPIRCVTLKQALRN